MNAVAGYGAMFGGKAPALIWHDFMAVGDEEPRCDPFPEPKEPFERAPFFGRYATTGAPGRRPRPLDGDRRRADDEKDKKDKKDKDGRQDGEYPRASTTATRRRRTRPHAGSARPTAAAPG